MKNPMLVTIIVAVLVAAGAFYGGTQYEKSKLASSSAMGQYAQANPNGAGGQRRFGRFGGNGMTPVIGKILSEDANSITVQLQDGSSKIVNYSTSTKISKTDTASPSDLTSGQTVVAVGTSNSDGSLTAQTIQLNPMIGMMRGGGRGQQMTPPTQ